MHFTFKSWWRRFLQFLQDTYMTCIPFGTFIQYAKYKKQANIDMSTIIELIDINDDLYKQLKTIGFAYDIRHNELRVLLDRARICPNAADVLTVEIDAEVWLNEQLRQFANLFYQFDIDYNEEIAKRATYYPDKDAVLLRIYSIYADVAADAKQSLFTNGTLSISLLLNVVLIILLCTIN